MSFFGHLHELGTPDPSGRAQRVVTAIIGVGWGLAILALAACVLSSEDRRAG